jgi:hypothetical protein
MTPPHTHTQPARFRPRDYALVGAAYVVATWLTNAWFMGDTSVYADAIVAHDAGRGGIPLNPFLEFGHLLWRPTGWLAYRLTRPLTALFMGHDARAQVTLTLMALNWLAGLWSILCLRAIVARACRRAWAADAAALAFLCTNTFLNYAQSGCAYVPGLALLLTGVYWLAPGGARAVENGESGDALETNFSWRRACGAGFCLAGAVCFWFPYLLALPGAFAWPLLTGHGRLRERSRLALRAVAACAVCGGGIYLAFMLALGIHTPAQFRAWVAEASHGFRLSGAARFVFGLARSFVNTGDDGLLFKRYLLHDPYSPVSLFELFRLSLLKVGLFYLLVSAVVLALLRGRRWTTLALLSLSAVPVFLFALFVFESGSPERYLPLYPAAFLALAVALSGGRARDWLRCVIIVCAAALAVSNLGALWAGRLAQKQGAVLARISELQPRLQPNSLVAVVHLQDELVNFYSNFPFHPLNRQGTLNIHSVTEPGTDRNLTWRQDFAAKALSRWAVGGDVWLSERLFAQRPRPEWNWAEGDDPRVSWADFAPLFTQFEIAERVGGEDGFALLARTPRNEELLRRVAQEPRPAGH